MRGRRGAAPSLIDVLKAYDAVLRREGVDADSDTFFYRTILRMSLDPSADWWTKLENERRVRAEVKQPELPSPTCRSFS